MLEGSGGGGGGSPRKGLLDFYSWSPLSWVSKSFRQDIGQISTLNVFLLLKMYYYDWNVVDFRKTVETGVGPRLHSFIGRNRRCMQLDKSWVSHGKQTEAES